MDYALDIGTISLEATTRNVLAYLRNAKSGNSANSNPQWPGSCEGKSASAEAHGEVSDAGGSAGWCIGSELVATAAWEGAGASAAAAFTPGLGEHGVTELEIVLR